MSKPGNWSSQYEFTGTMLENPSEEAIKLLNEEVMINEWCFSKSICYISLDKKAEQDIAWEAFNIRQRLGLFV